MGTHIARRVLATSAVAAAIVAGSLTPAAAGSVRMDDPNHDAGRGLEIQSVKVSNLKHRVVTRVDVGRLDRSTKGKVWVTFDTNPRRAGTEFGTALRLRPFKAVFYKTARPRVDVRRCDVRHTPMYEKDRVRLVVPRGCLNRPGKVRVKVETERGYHHDYAPNGRYTLTRWIRRG
jgi:hypothetical protein